MQYCSLQHWTLLLSRVASTNGCCFCFGSITSFFLQLHSVELFLHWSLVVYWATTDLGSSSFSIISFCLFILFTGFSRQEYWSGLPFPCSGNHILSELSTMTCPSWVVPMAWLSFIELDKAVVHVIKLASFLWLWFQSALWCPLLAPIVVIGFLFPWTWVIYHGHSNKAQLLLLTLDVLYLLMAGPPDLVCGESPLSHSPLQRCTVFHSNCTNLHTLHHCTSAPFFSNLFFVDFLMIASLMRYEVISPCRFNLYFSDD